MAKKIQCTICKHYGNKTPEGEELEKTQVYDETGTPVPIRLCRSHSVELFKMGQKKFLLHHYRILVELIDSDEPKFISILEYTCKKFPDSIS